MEKKILVVDDELRMREMFYDLLSRKGYKILTAPGAGEAIEIVRQENPDLVLIDIKMPNIDGIETLKKIREFDARIRIVMLTGMDDVELEKQARLIGASGFLRKELDLSLITKPVDGILAEIKEVSAAEAKKILIVDDNLQIRSFLERFLIKKGFYALSAASGEEALEKIKTAKPIIVLLDIKMPGMDGLMTLKRIKEINEDIGVIMITGVEDEDIGEVALKSGAYDYITKPLDLDYLEMCLLTKILLLSA